MQNSTLSINNNISNEMINKWQKSTNLLASIFDVPSALIMKVKNERIEVLIKSSNENNPYEVGESEVLINSGLYCEHVIKHEQVLYVKDALEDPDWCENPDLKLNMTNYLGFPIFNEKGDVFGTLCILDCKKKDYSQTQIDLLKEFKCIIEEDLKISHKNAKLIELEKMAALGKLVAGVAHEINTPLGISVTGITHFLELSKDLNGKFDKNEMSEEDFLNFMGTSKELASLIYNNLTKADSLIKSFKQIAVDQTSEQKRVFKLHSYMHEIILSLSSIIKKTSLNINITCDKNIQMYGHAGSLSQIISNLIINSIKHGFNKNQEGEININCEKRDKHVLIFYRDNGKGIKEKNLKKIFDPFFTTNRENGGTGLGLNIIQNIITKHFKGSISCLSTFGKGVLFTIFLEEN